MILLVIQGSECSQKNDSPSASATTLQRRLPRPLLAGIMLSSLTSSKKKKSNLAIRLEEGRGLRFRARKCQKRGLALSLVL